MLFDCWLTKIACFYEKSVPPTYLFIYLFVCLLPAAFQETKATDSREDSMEVLCSAV